MTIFAFQTMTTSFFNCRKLFFLLFIFFTYSPNFSYSQSLLRKKAEKYYQQLAYKDAVICYESILKKESSTEKDFRQTIECYMQIVNYKFAEKHLERFFKKFPGVLTHVDYINYINTLKYNKKYKKADSLLKRMEIIYPTNSFMTKHKYQSNYLHELKMDSTNYFVKNISDLNTKFSDFALICCDKDSANYFSSNRGGFSFRNQEFGMDNSQFLDIYQCNIKDSVNFENIKHINKGVGTRYHDGPIAFSYDGKTMFLTRNNYLKRIGESKNNIVNLKLYILKWDSLNNCWQEPSPFEYNSDEYSIGQASINREGTKLYFISDMPGGYGKTDIYESELKNSKWQKPVNLGTSINTEEREMFPFVIDDGTLFFSSDGRVGLGGLDVYYSPIQYGGSVEAQNLGYPINSSSDDFSISIRKNLVSGYLSSNREGGMGSDDVYFFNSKTSLLKPTLKGTIKDEISGQIIPLAKVYLLDKTINRIDSFVVDSTGRYFFSVNIKHAYEISSKETVYHYSFKNDQIALKQSDNLLDIFLTPKYKIIFRVIDSKSNKRLDSVFMVLKNVETNKTLKVKTNQKGIFETIVKNKKIGDKILLELKLEKEGYITVVEDIWLNLDSATVIEIENPMEFKMEKIVKGVDLAKIINLKPIYFDLDKWHIRSDAAIELNKIIRVLIENPNIKIELGSHTDCRSNNQYNLKLSSLRAKSAAEYITSRGINKDRVVSKGYGEARPITKCACEGTYLPICTEEQHQLNRRTEFLISGF